MIQKYTWYVICSSQWELSFISLFWPMNKKNKCLWAPREIQAWIYLPKTWMLPWKCLFLSTDYREELQWLQSCISPVWIDIADVCSNVTSPKHMDNLPHQVKAVRLLAAALLPSPTAAPSSPALTGQQIKSFWANQSAPTSSSPPKSKQSYIKNLMFYTLSTLQLQPLISQKQS